MIIQLKLHQKVALLLLFFGFFLIFLKLNEKKEVAIPLLVDFPMSKCAKSQETQTQLEAESAQIRKRGEENAKLYVLKPNVKLKDISNDLLTHPHTAQVVKDAILKKTHQYYIFSYISNGLKVKGYIGVPQVASPIPLIVYLRGGNQLFGLPMPDQLSTQEGYAIVATTYRGGVSEGKDEFGGKDVNDVINLFDFLPNLEKELKIKFHSENKYLVGVSRGGMQLFLTLNRYPEVQRKVKKVASVGGLLNLALAIEERPDFKKMLIENFGLTMDEKGKQWIAYRNPVQNTEHISTKLPIMIAQGTDDNRVCLKEGYDMLQVLHDKKANLTYVEIEGGNHSLFNSPDFNRVFFDWLEQ